MQQVMQIAAVQAIKGSLIQCMLRLCSIDCQFASRFFQVQGADYDL